MRLPWSKVCSFSDWADPELRATIRELAPNAGPDFPAGVEHRKQWEMAQTVCVLRACGVLHRDAEILGVGAGVEQTLFYLTNHARRVFATDLYGTTRAWRQTAPREMLVDPGRFAELPWCRERLVVQHADAADLPYADASFDGLFSTSSIEHFGDDAAIRRAAGEMYRVLKPGGVAVIVTELRLAGPPPGIRVGVRRRLAARLLTWDEIDELIVSPLPWVLTNPVVIADELPGPVLDFSLVVRDQLLARLGIRRPERFPHVVLRARELVWTSVSLGLVKPPVDRLGVGERP